MRAHDFRVVISAPTRCNEGETTYSSGISQSSTCFCRVPTLTTNRASIVLGLDKVLASRSKDDKPFAFDLADEGKLSTGLSHGGE
jgi:hypothetical protein